MVDWFTHLTRDYFLTRTLFKILLELVIPFLPVTIFRGVSDLVTS